MASSIHQQKIRAPGIEINGAERIWNDSNPNEMHGNTPNAGNIPGQRERSWDLLEMGMDSECNDVNEMIMKGT